MEDASFHPTQRQSFGHGLYVGMIIAALATAIAVVAGPPGWVWALLAFGPPAVGAAVGVAVGRRTGVEICAGGIRTRSVFADGLAPWNRVVDVREERRGGRTVVSVYLDSGASLQLRAPYTGGLFAADPRFEVKMFALSYMWRSHRFGGLPG
ncbi:hypothetical protein [Paractinoplanes globisporus]|uniref:PH domain-containing protein n=1 Tax=Paractinoplanes globisporus TaxID=113565 RepID=A0ABW6WJI5_9ACTN|nr:hypothetical protein [Actinoplanes globisporus]